MRPDQRFATEPFRADHFNEGGSAAQPVVLKALAKLAYDLNFNNRRPDNADEIYRKMLESLSDIDFSHNNAIWNYYGMTERERIDAGIDGLADYLPDDSGQANRDVGSKQGGFIRFGAKHNDIFPILADMIRWSLDLPSRREG